ncbi:MAG: hypothetical protein UV01_C0004G0112 [Parcubacteria group bacterium GW2011_GWA2_42_14]|nr:MAG: hypothetical protein UV01_C0004G0112 [Parcubacteria group bacterium GW2011_GWA2_42_14]
MTLFYSCHSEPFGCHSDPEPCEGEESQDKPCGEFIESIREESQCFRYCRVAEILHGVYTERSECVQDDIRQQSHLIIWKNKKPAKIFGLPGTKSVSLK